MGMSQWKGEVVWKKVWKVMSFLPQVREFKRFLESRFNDVETGFQVLDSITNSNR